MAGNALLHQIANPNVPDIYGAFRQGQADARQDRSRNALGKVLGGDKSAMPELLQNDPQQGFQVQQYLSQLDENSRKALAQNTEMAARELIGVAQIQDPQQKISAWQQALQRHKGMGLDTSSYEGLDPDSGMNVAASRIIPIAELVKQSRPDPQLAETARHNRAMEEAAAERARIMRDRLTNPPPQKAPPGYRYTPDNTLERTPGGPADLKFRSAMSKDKGALDSGTSAIDAAISNIDALIGAGVDDPATPDRDESQPHPGLKAITGSIDARTPTFFQTSKDAEVLAEAIRSQASIQGLANVRGTAGAVGAITEAEWPRLESLFSALQQSQGTPQFTENLKKYRNELSAIKRKLQGKFAETYEDGGQMPTMPQQPAQAPDVDALVDFYLNQP